TGQWENDPNPLYIDCEAFTRQGATRDLVNVIQSYCKKGDPLFIEGRLQLDQWEDKNGGGKRSKHKVVVDNIELLGGRGGGDGGGGMGEGAPPRSSRPMSSGSRAPAPRRSAPPADEPDEYGGGGGGGGGGDGDNIPF